MKPLFSLLVSVGFVLGGRLLGFAQPALPDASISVTVSPSVVDVGGAVTVTCRVTSYLVNQEVDVFAFVVNYNPKALSAVQGSFYLGTNSGANQQFLSKANQESVTNGYSITNLCDASRPGRAYVTVADSEVRVPPERGSIATNGFLVSFQMTVLAPGSWQLMPARYSDAVFYNTFHQPISANVSFSSPTVVVRNPTAVSVHAVDGSASEPGEDTAMFQFSRTGPVNDQAIARFNVTGSASLWDDYESIPTWIAIPAGASNVSLVITPVDDFSPEGDETVTVTLWTPGDYEISSPSTATVTIHDDENMPPAVALTSPANATIFPQITNITLTASASDANGSVTNVEFYREGTIKLGQDTSSPYSFTWSNAPPGNYVLTAKATDNLGATADSVPVSIMVRGAPSVVITSPTNNASFSSASSPTVTAAATDPDGPLAIVELFRNGTVFAITNGSTLSAAWSKPSIGSHTLTARACDDWGLWTTSAPVTVTVYQAGMSDNFSLRPIITGFTNYVTTNSTGWTWEYNEPVHGAQTGYRSGWIAWIAPASGTVTMDTFGSSFDTVLAIYTNAPPWLPGPSNLVLVAVNNDAGGTAQSQVSFNALAGQTYGVVVDGNTFGLSGTIHLHISLANSAPIITASPQSRVAVVGDDVNFHVSASGGSLAYQWRWNGANLSGATASNLTLASVSLTNAGLYDVMVSNSGGAVGSAPAILVVRAPAGFTALPSTQVVDPAGTATFNADATGNDPLFWQWSFNGTPLPGMVSSNYTRYNVQYADGGIYSVKVENAAGYATTSAELIVRPQFTTLTPSNGTLHLTWYGTTGKVYVVEGTTNLNPPSTSWMTLGTITNTALQGQFQVSLTNPPARLLRLRVGP